MRHSEQSCLQNIGPFNIILMVVFATNLAACSLSSSPFNRCSKSKEKLFAPETVNRFQLDYILFQHSHIHPTNNFPPNMHIVRHSHIEYIQAFDVHMERFLLFFSVGSERIWHYFMLNCLHTCNQWLKLIFNKFGPRFAVVHG